MPAIWLAILVGLAGALGAITRYATTEWVSKRWLGGFPVATLIINLSGAFLLAFLLTVGGTSSALLAPYRVVLGTGFLGGYTTFSTLTFETDALARRGATRLAILDGAGSVVAGIIAALAGVALGHLL